MMECNNCKTNGDEQPVFACDGCKVFLCKACANLTASETKVMQLKERTMQFHCKDCLNSNTINLLLSALNDKNIIIESKNKIIELLEKDMESGKQKEKDLKNKLAGMQVQTNSSKSNPRPQAENQSGASKKFMQNQTVLAKPTCADIVKNGNSLKNANSAATTNLSQGKNGLEKMEAAQREIMEEIININMDKDKTLMKINEEKREFQEVRFKKRTLKTGNGEGDGAFHGKNEAERKIWLFITRVPDDVKDENIKQYIEARTDTNNV